MMKATLRSKTFTWGLASSFHYHNDRKHGSLRSAGQVADPLVKGAFENLKVHPDASLSNPFKQCHTLVT